MTNRSDRIKALFNAQGTGLEIGPSHSPIMPKRDGHDVKILDYLDAEGLRRKYKAAGVNIDKVEEVDFIGDGRSLIDVIGMRHAFDWIIASHVIEHVPDMLEFLKDCEALLKPGGSLVLAVPDKRCCFDILRPVSTVGQVLQAHIDRRSRPSPGIIFDDVAYGRLRNGGSGWPIDASEPLDAARPLSDAWEMFDKACISKDYVDMHCWVFVPSSFRLIISALYIGGRIRLSTQRLDPVDGEFYAVLSDVDRPDLLGLGELARAAQLEEREAALGI